MGLGIISYRPAVDIEGDVEIIKKWCRENHSSWNAIMSSVIPALAYAVQMQVFIADMDDGRGPRRYIKADFGNLPLREKDDSWKIQIS